MWPFNWLSWHVVPVSYPEAAACHVKKEHMDKPLQGSSSVSPIALGQHCCLRVRGSISLPVLKLLALCLEMLQSFGHLCNVNIDELRKLVSC